MKRLFLLIFVLMISILLNSCANLKVSDNELFANNVNNVDTDKKTAINEEPENSKTYEKIIMDYNVYKALAENLDNELYYFLDPVIEYYNLPVNNNVTFEKINSVEKGASILDVFNLLNSSGTYRVLRATGEDDLQRYYDDMRRLIFTVYD